MHKLQNSNLALGKEGEWVREYKRVTFYFFKNQNQIWQNSMGRVQELILITTLRIFEIFCNLKEFNDTIIIHTIKTYQVLTLKPQKSIFIY